MDEGVIQNFAASVVGTLVTMWITHKSGIFLRLSAKKRAEWHARTYREMLRRMKNGGEMVAYVGQRVTIPVMGIFIVLMTQLMTANDPPLFFLVGNMVALLGGGFLIAVTGDELIRLSDFETWKSDRLTKLRKQLKRAGVAEADIDKMVDQMTKD